MATPKSVIADLQRSGMTEMQITEDLRQQGVEVTQATINRIKSGEIKRTSFEIGMALIRLQERRLAERRRPEPRATA